MIGQLISRRAAYSLRTYATEVASTTAPTQTVAVPVKKRSSNMKGGFVGFLLGVTITGFGSYYYLVDEYKNSSNAVVADVLSLQKSIRNLESHVRSLEDAAVKK